MLLVNRQVDCLCDQNLYGCETCNAEAHERWLAFAERYPQDRLGQLMRRAIESGRATVVLGILQQARFDINAPCEPGKYGSVSPLMVALRANDLQITALIMGRPDLDLAQSLPKFDTWTWAQSSSLELLQLFLSFPTTKINQQDGNGKTLLHEVIQDLRGADKLAFLLESDDLLVDLAQYDGTSPLYQAALVGNEEAVELLLKHPVDVNNHNSDNLWSVLMVAVAGNHAAVVEKLLRHPEIDVNALSDRSETALHLAAVKGYEPMTTLLLDHTDTMINRKNHMGWTPLHNAVQNHQADIVRLLLARPDLEVNFVDQDRQTALHWAVMVGNSEEVRLLLEHPQQNTHITNRPAEQTATDLALSLGQTVTAELIRQQMETGPDADELSDQDDYEHRDYKGPPIKRTKPLIGDPPLPF